MGALTNQFEGISKAEFDAMLRDATGATREFICRVATDEKGQYHDLETRRFWAQEEQKERISVAVRTPGEPKTQSPDFKEKLEELRGFLADPHHIPPGIKEALLCLSQHQTKLFRWRPVTEATFEAGTFDPFSRLYASDFLNKLLAAIRAFDWPAVLVLVHGLSSPKHAAPLMLSSAGVAREDDGDIQF